MKMIETELLEPPSSIRIAFLDVGQADTIVVTCPETREAIVVDCVNPKAVLDYLTQEKIIYLRGIIITHLHADHYSGVIGLLENYHRVPGLKACEVVIFNKIFNQKNLHQLLTDDDPHSPDDDNFLTTWQKLIDWHKQNKLSYTDLKVKAGQPFTAFTVRVLCTQATEQCQQSVLNIRQNILSKLKAQADKSNYPVFGSKVGCPCAGTIVVELSDHVQVLQPEINFHSEEIIKPHFALRKCNI